MKVNDLFIGKKIKFLGNIKDDGGFKWHKDLTIDKEYTLDKYEEDDDFEMLFIIDDIGDMIALICEDEQFSWVNDRFKYFEVIE